MVGVYKIGNGCFYGFVGGGVVGKVLFIVLFVFILRLGMLFVL